MPRIFISYKRVDKDKVFKIKDQIESALGEKCWIDLDGIESDAQFVDVIIRALDCADVVLFMYSKAHTFISDYENDWTIRELSYANTERKRIVFVNIDGSPLTRWFKFMYSQKQQVDGMSRCAVDKLVIEIKGWLRENHIHKEINILKNSNAYKRYSINSQCVVLSSSSLCIDAIEITLNESSMEVFNFINSHVSCTLDDIVDYMFQIYEVDKILLKDDITSLLKSLVTQNVVIEY